MVANSLTYRRKALVQENFEGPNVLIDLIIANEEKFSFDEIRDHLQSLIAGYETITLSLSHTILLLAIHPDLQEKLFNEITNVCAENSGVMDCNVTKKCEYLDMVFDESCRVLPSVPIVLRETLKDFEIEKDVIVPQGVCMVINFFALHRNKLYWGDDVDDFKPERFSKENSDKRVPNTFFPFSTGQRICIAAKYSDICTKLLIAQLVRKYKFKTSLTMRDLKLKSFISLKLCGPHSVTIEERS